MSMSDDEYAKRLNQIAEYAEALGKLDSLNPKDTIAVGDVLSDVFHDGRWIDERAAQRGGESGPKRRPVDPTSRNQFAQWVRDRWQPIAPRTTYRLLDASDMARNYLANGQTIPTSEGQIRPLKPLLSVANGGGVRVEPVWRLACDKAKEDGREQPTERDVRSAVTQWKQENLPKGQPRQETKVDRAWRKKTRASAAWKELFAYGGDEQINAFLDEVRADVEKWTRDHE